MREVILSSIPEEFEGISDREKLYDEILENFGELNIEQMNFMLEMISGSQNVNPNKSRFSRITTKFIIKKKLEYQEIVKDLIDGNTIRKQNSPQSSEYIDDAVDKSVDKCVDKGVTNTSVTNCSAMNASKVDKIVGVKNIDIASSKKTVSKVRGSGKETFEEQFKNPTKLSDYVL